METYLCDRGEGKIKVLSKEETKRLLKGKRSNFNRIDLQYNLNALSNKCRVIYNYILGLYYFLGASLRIEWP